MLTTRQPRRFGLRRPLWEVLSEMLQDEALLEQIRGRPDGEVLNNERIPEDLRYKALAAQRKLRYIDPTTTPPLPEAERYLPRSAILDYEVYPHTISDRRLVILTSRPGDQQTLQELHRLLANENLGLELAVSPPSAMRELLDSYRMRSRLDDKVKAASQKTVQESPPKAEEAAAGPIVEFVNSVIRKAINIGASDIHIEPTASRLVVRFRVDGRLRLDDTEIPPELAPEIITRIKIMAQLNIAERRRPQDGRIAFRDRDAEVNLRVNVGPVHLGNSMGEQVVMRLLPKETEVPALDQLGFSTQNLERFKSLLSLANGIILVTGPTGSGKSTTLAAAISQITSPEIKILSIEDPVEYRIPGVIQSQVNEAAGYTFDTALRAFLRQDPDVIYVGEIRDAETATIAIQAALTGHLVFGTLHTNDAPSSVTRLLQMGLKPYNVAGALRGVLAQRLVRKVCPRCKAPLPAEESRRVAEAIRDELGIEPDPNKLVHGTGKSPEGGKCPSCGGTGYKGRTGVHELFVVTPKVAELIAQEAPTEALRKAASDLTPLRLDGLAKVAEGITTYEEVIRATLE